MWQPKKQHDQLLNLIDEEVNLTKYEIDCASHHQFINQSIHLFTTFTLERPNYDVMESLTETI